VKKRVVGSSILLKIAPYLACTGLLFSFSTATIAADVSAPNYEILQKNAMAQARSGEYDQAIPVLESIVRKHPDDRRSKRDLLAVYSWAGKCRGTFRLYHQFKSYEIDDPVTLAAVGSCLIKDERYLEANRVLTPAREKYSYDRKILDLYLNVRKQLATYKPWYSYSGIEAGASDIGGNAVSFESELSRDITDGTSLFARIKLAHEHDPAFGDGTLKRLGTGFEHRFYSGLHIRTELSGNLEGPVDTGIGAKLDYPISDTFKVSSNYVTYAENISLPAIGLGITADRFGLGADFHSDDWTFKGSASAAQWRFSDTNLRQDASLDVSYAYSTVDKHWRRIGLAIDHETNSYAGASYFNPSDANTIVAYHSWEIPFDTARIKHSDKLTLKAGIVAQAGFGTEAISEAAYEQKFQISDNASIGLNYSLASNVYDGARETDATVSFSFERSF